MLGELRRQRIKGLVEAGGMADEALPPEQVSGRWIGVRSLLLRSVIAGAVLVSLLHSGWTLLVMMLE